MDERREEQGDTMIPRRGLATFLLPPRLLLPVAIALAVWAAHRADRGDCERVGSPDVAVGEAAVVAAIDDPRHAGPEPLTDPPAWLAGLRPGDHVVGGDLSGRSLREFRAVGVRFGRCDFTGADLRSADLRGAEFFYCTFGRAQLEGADFRGAYSLETWWPEGRYRAPRGVLACLRPR